MGLVKEWIPYEVSFNKSPVTIKWLKAEGFLLRHPFFRQSVAAYKESFPGHEEATTDLSEILNLRPEYSHKPDGFIFHVSRCGSTLVSNLLQDIEGITVISEPQPIAAMLLPYSKDLWHMEHSAWLELRTSLIKNMFSALKASPHAAANKCYIKFSSWNILMLEEILKIWPDVPWVLIYRSPLEVMVSTLGDAAGWITLATQPGVASLLTGCAANELAEMTREEFCARILGKFYSIARHNLPHSRALALDYKNFSIDTLLMVLHFLGIDPGLTDRSKVEQRMSVYSKDPDQKKLFTRDSETKRKEASLLVHRLTNTWATGDYQHLSDIAQEVFAKQQRVVALAAQ